MKTAKEKFSKRGYLVRDNFLNQTECRVLLADLEQYRSGAPLQRVYRKHKERSLDYQVIDGVAIAAHLRNVMKLYRRINRIVNRLDSVLLKPLDDIRAAVNVNITPPGGEYRWHYDRNRVTALLYLNRVEGGELQFYPKYRILLPPLRHSRIQQWIDQAIRHRWIRRIFGSPVDVKPKPGRLLILRADVSLHSVSPVKGTEARINLVMAYEDARVTSRRTNLDSYLYDGEYEETRDPNYLR